MKSIYTIPKVVKFDDLSKPWYVFFRYDKKLFRFKYGINFFKNYKKREFEANALCDALHQKLKESWNPLIPDLGFDNAKMILNEADFAISKKKPNL